MFDYADDYNGWGGKRRSAVIDKPKPVQAGWRGLELAKPRRGQTLHWGNLETQGTLICQTKGYPHEYDPVTTVVTSAYSDRLYQWDYDHMCNVCREFLGVPGDQGWGSRLPGLGDEVLKRFAQAALKLPVPPTHVRAIYYYNVGNGYDCPVLEAVYLKQCP